MSPISPPPLPPLPLPPPPAAPVQYRDNGTYVAPAGDAEAGVCGAIDQYNYNCITFALIPQIKSLAPVLGNWSQERGTWTGQGIQWLARRQVRHSTLEYNTPSMIVIYGKSDRLDIHHLDERRPAFDSPVVRTMQLLFIGPLYERQNRPA